MTLLGIILGFGSALLFAVSYMLSRRAASDERFGQAKLFVMAHVMIAVASLAVIALFLGRRMPSVAEYWAPAVTVSGFYSLGQVLLFVSLRMADASRVAPLLGVKVVAVAVILMLWQGRSRRCKAPPKGAAPRRCG